MRHFLLALQLLTRYPSPPVAAPRPRDFGRATGYFPLVGLLAGLDLFFLRWLTLFDQNGLHYPLWAVLILAYWSYSSGSLHLDALADTADALGSGKREAAFLDVLKDSRIGAFGAAALGLDLLAKYVWLRYLPMQSLWFLPLPLLFSRLLSSLNSLSRPYAGKPGSLGWHFIHQARTGDFNRALGWAFGGFILLAAPSIYLRHASVAEAALALGVCLGGCLGGWLALRVPRARLGGINGDLVGYAQEIAELLICYGLFLTLVRQP